MTVLLRAGTLALFAGALASCVTPEWAGGNPIRIVQIANHRFEPGRITVKAGVPVTLVVEGIDETSLLFSSPQLGIAPTPLRAHLHYRSGGRLAPADYYSQGKRFELEPLRSGVYDLVCICHGRPAKGILIVQ